MTMNTKTVLITGCSSGIGRALTEEFLRHGYLVYAAARNTESLANLTSEHLIPLQMDVNNADDITRAATTIRERSGHLHCLINNAGYAAMGPVAELSSESLQQQFATNVFAPIALTKALLPLLQAGQNEKHPAQVVNIGSVSGILTTPFSGAYCATKAALHALSDALRMELAPFNIQVITVQPGAIQSKFGDNSLANLGDLIQPDSLYAPLKQQIQARATASQDNPTPAADFARELMAQLLSQPDPVIRIGNGSRALPFMKRWIPLALLDKILSKKFGLLALKR
ncbi:SDR family oxidoreductase [Thalassolituus pacificus]|uniref:SDR family oxidoreductase n=1 Tax=Thalassolituus pacificus TaxID=2975440 RepID=A0A9X3AQB2_9GAMM|nr:SDR family oxidoreductase [Thalassolituus pacificus]MCT7357664.1 SDR family oxidoreductase [Thalassolituus pacificus]